MRDPQRIDRVLKLIGDYWKEHPDMRFMQLLYGIIPIITFPDYGWAASPNLFYYEDNKLEESLRTSLQHIEKESNKLYDDSTIQMTIPGLEIG